MLLLTSLSLLFMLFIVVPSHVAVDLADILAVVVAAGVDVCVCFFPSSLAICV